MLFKVEFTGLSELTRELENKFGTDYNEPVLKAGGDYLKDKLEDSVYSFGLKKRTGKSEKSFTTKIADDKKSIDVGLKDDKDSAFYLYFHEYGTSKMRARPFMRPTFENNQKAILEKMANEMRKVLKL